MILKKYFHIALVFLALSVASSTMAQDDKVKSLGDILNEKPDYERTGTPLTSAIMANYYYKSCTAEESLVFDADEQDILCGCTAAKMSENLTVQDFKNIPKNTVKGRDARGRMLAYAYAPCMLEVIEKKVNTDCRQSKKLADILIGKKTICKCSAARFKNFVAQNASFIIMNAIHNEPMTINPLKYYFLHNNYNAQHRLFIKQCRFKFEYNRDNL